jgi:ATP-dependent Lon protease
MKRKDTKSFKKRQRETSDCDSDKESNVDCNDDKDLNIEKKEKIERIEKRIKTEEKKKEIQTKYGPLEKKINEEIKNREIHLDKIYELKLEMDDYIWFYKYIQIRDEMNGDTEEKINLSNQIYQKYMRLKDIDYHKMEKLKEEAVTEKCIVKRIVNSEHNDYTKTILFKKYKLFCENNDSCSEEYSKCIEWIDTVLSLPTTIIESSPVKSSEIGNKLLKLHNFLSNKIYGLNQVKEKIMEAMCCKILNPYDTSGKILTLLGPPGVGKTSVASTIAEAMNLPFEQISFGSIQDSKILTGHSSTYIGALPGLFTKILIKAKRLDSLVLLDEIDKITNASDSNITSVLFHVLDKSQNHRFKDIYIPEIPLDLSQIIFLCAANHIDQIDPILRDRMTIINLP